MYLSEQILPLKSSWQENYDLKYAYILFHELQDIEKFSYFTKKINVNNTNVPTHAIF